MKAIKKDLLILGAGGHSRVLIDTAELLGYVVLGIVDVNYYGQEERILGYPVIGDISALSSYSVETTEIVIAFGDNAKRREYFTKVREMGFNVPALIHPSSVLSKYVKLKEGVFINAGVIVNALAEVEENSIINTGSIIEHEVKIGKNSHICPGVRIAGRVMIGNNTFVGTGSTIIDKITIGDNVIIGAGSVVIRDIKSNSKVAGIPARELK
ncbi:MAG: acetyltransferase [Candidatus Stygibacter australis]|nr:acetyltransferase [Candidatus Stygibacter australis]MDP8321127.1 acetyltransferase [Candidatus Stygibacter australis]